MTQYKLTYFNMTAIAEPIRWTFRYAKVPFEDERIPFDEWQTQKHRAPLGQLPILIENGKLLTQSGAIGRYLGKKFGLTTGNEFLDYRVDQVTDILDDGCKHWRLFLLENDKKKKLDYKKSWMEDHLPKVLNQLNEIVEENGGPFITGTKLTYGDFFLASWVQIWTKTVRRNFLDDYAAVSRQIETVLSLPEIKEWIEERPKSTV